MKLKVNDTVKVTTGKDKGKQGKIVKVFPRTSQVLVEGLNKYKRHLKPRSERQPGGIVAKERPLPVANLALICPKCHQPTRIGYQLEANQAKVRICRKCKNTI